MTVQQSFHDYQSFPIPDPRTCSPLLNSIRNWLLGNWGGMDLGCYGERPIRGGTRLSTHAYGAAHDWRYSNPGPGRDVMLAEVMPILLNMSAELGIDAVHDYAYTPGGRVWRPPGTSGRPSGDVENGWRNQGGQGSGMGTTWALWLHIEIHPSRWHDPRSVDEMLEIEPPPPPPPCVPNFAQAQFCDYPKRKKGTYHTGDDHRDIAYWQGVQHYRTVNFAHLYGTVAENIANRGGSDQHSAKWYRDLANRLFRARDLCARLKIDGNFGKQTTTCNAAVEAAFEGRKINKKVMHFDGKGSTIGKASWNYTDRVADGRW